jgi:hypothetical protein
VLIVLARREHVDGRRRVDGEQLVGWGQLERLGEHG